MVVVRCRGTELYNLFILSGISKFTTLMVRVLWNGRNSSSSSRGFIRARSFIIPKRTFPLKNGILTNSFQIEDLSEEESVRKAEILFSKIDINNEGYVTEEEFVAVCLGDPDLVTVMRSQAED